MARRRDRGRDPIDIEIEPVRTSRRARPADSLHVRNVDDAELDDELDPVDDDQDVQWQVALVVVLATLMLVAVSVVGLTRRAVDPLAVTSTTSIADGVTVETVPPPRSTLPPDVGLIAEEGAPWPADVAILVASEHGVDRITGEKGEVVVTRVDVPPPTATAVVDPVTGTTVPSDDASPSTVPSDTVVADGATPSVERAFEVQDGSLVFQYTRGDIVRLAPDGTVSTLVPSTPGLLLEDADMPGADLHRLVVVYRTATDDPGATFALHIRTGSTSVETPVRGGWGVSYGRFTVFAPNSAATTWVDDTGVRGTAFVSFPDGEQARSSVDPSGEALLHLAGDPNEFGTVVLTTGHLRSIVDGTARVVTQTSTVSGADVRGSSVVIQRDDDTSEYYDMSPYRRYDVPVRGYATVSRFVHSPLVDNVSSALTQDNPRTCIVGFPGNDHRIALYSQDLDADQIAAAEVTVVDGFAALISTLDDGSFVIRVTFDACELHLRVVDATRLELAQILFSADVGHVGVWAQCDPSADCAAPPGTDWSTSTGPSPSIDPTTPVESGTPSATSTAP